MSLKHSEKGCISWEFTDIIIAGKAMMSLRLTLRNGMRRHGKILMLEEPKWV